MEIEDMNPLWPRSVRLLFHPRTTLTVIKLLGSKLCAALVDKQYTTIDKKASGATAVEGSILRVLHLNRLKTGQGSMNVGSVDGVWHP